MSLFERAVAAMGQAVVITDPSGHVLHWNPAAERLYGYTAAEARGRVLRELIVPAGAREQAAAAAARIAEGGSYAGDWTVCDRDGRLITVFITTTPIRDDAGAVVAMLGVSTDVTERRAAEARARGLAAIVEGSGDAIIETGGDGVVRAANAAVRAVFGYEPDELVGRELWCLVPEERRAEAEAATAAVLAGETVEPFTTERLRRDGSRVATSVRLSPVRDAAGAVVAVSGISRDVSAETRTRAALAAGERRFRARFEQVGLPQFVADLDGRAREVNQAFADLVGHDRAGLAGWDLGALAAGETGTRDTAVTRADGTEVPVLAHVTLLREADGTPYAVAGFAHDLTELRRAEDELRRRALRDELTGLANRTLLADRLDQAVARAGRTRGGSVAVLFADLDQFKLVNDSLGHEAGDALLVQVAERLAAATRPGDTVARFGGDEFVVVCEGADEAAAHLVAEDLLGTLAEPFDLGGQPAYITASVGIAVSPPHTGADLMRFADAAMYDAKGRGRGRVHVFDTALAEAAADRLALGNDLRAALRERRLELHYQPVVDLTSGRPVAVEALARWHHPDRGDVPAATFVAMAESAGLIAELDRWAVDTACRDAGHLRRALGGEARVAVNVSARHLADGDFEAFLLDALRRHRVPAGGLSLEITEGAVVDRPERTRALLERLRERGITAAIDDFGTGYSSLGYLTRLPVTTLKIDRAFVENVTDDPDALAVAASIVDLARTVKLETVAEGVETVAQLTVLETLGCTYGQGYLWAPALPLAELTGLVGRLPGGAFDVTRRAATPLPRSSRDERVTADHGLPELMRLHREGASLSTIAAALNSDGYRTPRGSRWHRSTVAQVISDLAYPHLWQR
ncbi:MAG TPA: EAL domain-containing protein [Mycobacteriales bacterium]|jgi:diguanylate cyclase (GGDEF)-like protein/PAS domain S-box-containing protein|nr:EAL domain-containing protein [Mycobacteriales bacterium]